MRERAARKAAPCQAQLSGHPHCRERRAGRLPMLDAAEKNLKPGGRLAVITFHSLDDRIKKNYRSLHRAASARRNFRCVCGRKPKVKLITRKLHRFAKKNRRESPCPQRQAARRRKVLTTAENTQKKEIAMASRREQNDEILPLQRTSQWQSRLRSRLRRAPAQAAPRA